MLFDELRDPDPPTPGLHEFAAVAARARQIRRRRITWMVRAASLVVLAGAALAWSQMADRTALAPTGAPATTPGATTIPTTTVPLTTAPSTVVPLREMIGSTVLPAIGLDSLEMVVNVDPLVVLLEGEGGGVCTQIETEPTAGSCTAAGAGLFASEWPGGQVIAVHPTVDASIDAGAGCSQLPDLPDFPVVKVWICSNLDLDAATVAFVGDRRVVVRGG